MDLYGNLSPLKVSNGRAVFRLTPRTSYVVDAADVMPADDLAASLAVADDGRSVTLSLRNARQEPIALSVRPSAHALVSMTGREMAVTLQGGETRTFNYPFTARKTSDGRRLDIAFTLTETSGIEHVVSVDVARAARCALPANLVQNSQMNDWTEASHPDGWQVRVIKGTGGRDPGTWKVSRENLDGFLAAPSASIWVKGIQPWFFARIELFQDVVLKPNARYYFSAAKRLAASGNWPFPLLIVKGGRNSQNACEVHVQEASLPNSPAHDRGWGRFEATFETGADDQCAVQIVLRMQNIGYGEVRFDDVELYELERENHTLGSPPLTGRGK